MKRENGAVDPAQMTALLRAGVLSMDPSSLGMVGPGQPSIWGAMLEFGHPEVITSLVVLADGSVSIYLSDGSGVIGCGLHRDVSLAARKMLALAGRARSHCLPMTQFPAPHADSVTVYLLTQDGVYGAEVMRADLDEGAVELAELYYAGHGVIGIVELLGAGVDLVDEMQIIKAQLGRELTDSEALEQQIGQRELPTRGRACRILPYVGNVVRRSQN